MVTMCANLLRQWNQHLRAPASHDQPRRVALALYLGDVAQRRTVTCDDLTADQLMMIVRAIRQWQLLCFRHPQFRAAQPFSLVYRAHTREAENRTALLKPG
jgi:hypothetical protein